MWTRYLPFDFHGSSSLISTHYLTTFDFYSLSYVDQILEPLLSRLTQARTRLGPLFRPNEAF
ncbi:hypothetical protein Hanom_Chr06g00520111 [Helianthus anomalus]